MRTADAWTNGTDSMNSSPVGGWAWAPETFVQVRWGWIFYMAFEILAAAMFLVLTVQYTQRLKIQVLKSSPLATLLALNDDTRSVVGGITTAAHARTQARAVTVNLVGSGMSLSRYTPSAGSSRKESRWEKLRKTDIRDSS